MAMDVANIVDAGKKERERKLGVRGAAYIPRVRPSECAGNADESKEMYLYIY